MVELSDLAITLKPFYDRASEAEARLTRVEAALNSRKDSGNEELLKTIDDLQLKLDSEKKKAEMLAVENEKFKYRLIHLLRPFKEADPMLTKFTGPDTKDESNKKEDESDKKEDDLDNMEDLDKSEDSKLQGS